MVSDKVGFLVGNCMGAMPDFAQVQGLVIFRDLARPLNNRLPVPPAHRGESARRAFSFRRLSKADTEPAGIFSSAAGICDCTCTIARSPS